MVGRVVFINFRTEQTSHYRRTICNSTSAKLVSYKALTNEVWMALATFAMTNNLRHGKAKNKFAGYFSFVLLRMSLNFFSYMVFLCPVCRVDFYFPDPHKDRRFRTNRFQLSRQPFLIAAVGCHMHPNKKSGKERHTGASCGQTIIYTIRSSYQILRKNF